MCVCATLKGLHSSATQIMVPMASLIPYVAFLINIALSASSYINVSYEGFCKGVTGVVVQLLNHFSY